MKRNLIKRKIAAVITTCAAAAAPVVSQAATITNNGTISYGSSTNTSTADFASFATTVLGWAQGSLGVGLALTSILVGAGFSVAKNTPMPILAGVALAAFIHWGPVIVGNLMGATFV